MSENTVNQELQIVKNMAEKHAAKMRVQANNKATKCVDGGYRAGQAEGAIAMAGGALGLSMVLLRLGFTPRESFDLVFDYLQSKGITYGWHTDHHEGHDGVIVGCGHCNAAIKSGEAYDLDGVAVKELLDIIRTEQERNPESMELVSLNREHIEQAILVVTSEEYTVKPWDQEATEANPDGVQFFIYDKVRHVALLSSLIQELQAQGKAIDLTDALQQADHQTTTTLGLLGSSKGKPIFTVDVSQAQPKIEFVANAPILS